MFAISTVVVYILMPQPSFAIVLQAPGLLRYYYFDTPQYYPAPCLVPSCATWPNFHLGEGCEGVTLPALAPGVRRGTGGKQNTFSTQGLFFLPSEISCMFYKVLWILESSRTGWGQGGKSHTAEGQR